MSQFNDEIIAQQQAYESFLREQVLNDEERQGFTGLKFYPPDERFLFRVQPEFFAQPESVEGLTTKGDTRTSLRVGTATIAVDGQEVMLSLYASADDTEREHLYIPFKDATSQTETYGAGRNLNVEREGDTYVLDFNKALNPYCAYSERWNCTLPPQENHLTVSIPAGEKRYK